MSSQETEGLVAAAEPAETTDPEQPSSDEREPLKAAGEKESAATKPKRGCLHRLLCCYSAAKSSEIRNAPSRITTGDVPHFTHPPLDSPSPF